MATSYVTKAIRCKIIDSILDAMLEVGDITDSQVADTQAWLLSLNNTELRRECDDRCPDKWSRLAG